MWNDVRRRRGSFKEREKEKEGQHRKEPQKEGGNDRSEIEIGRKRESNFEVKTGY